MISDMRTREVTDKLWVVYGVSGLTVTLIKILLDSSSLLPIAISIGLTILIALGFAQFNLFGGADAKALICLALTTPLTPSSIHPILGYTYPYLPILVLLVAYVYSGLVIVWIIGKNFYRYAHTGKFGFCGDLRSVSWWKKVFATISGYPVSLDELKASIHLYPMERFTNEGGLVRRQFRFSLDVAEERPELISNLEMFLRKHYPEADIRDFRFWATPGLPMLLFIFVGFISSILLGDTIFGLLLRN